MVLEKLKITIYENQYHGGFRRSGVSNTLKSAGSGKSLFLGPPKARRRCSSLCPPRPPLFQPSLTTPSSIKGPRSLFSYERQQRLQAFVDVPQDQPWNGRVHGQGFTGAEQVSFVNFRVNTSFPYIKTTGTGCKK